MKCCAQDSKQSTAILGVVVAQLGCLNAPVRCQGLQSTEQQQVKAELFCTLVCDDVCYLFPPVYYL